MSPTLNSGSVGRAVRFDPAHHDALAARDSEVRGQLFGDLHDVDPEEATACAEQEIDFGIDVDLGHDHFVGQGEPR